MALTPRISAFMRRQFRGRLSLLQSIGADSVNALRYRQRVEMPTGRNSLPRWLTRSKASGVPHDTLCNFRGLKQEPVLPSNGHIECRHTAGVGRRAAHADVSQGLITEASVSSKSLTLRVTRMRS